MNLEGPIIGLTGNIDDDGIVSVYAAYAHAIEATGGIPMLLPYVTDEETLERFVALCDGFFFTGGADVDPMRYGEEKKDACGSLAVLRDALEFAVMKKVLAADKPLLAVCRGAQVLNVFLGGSLYQDIPSECPSEISHRQKEDKYAPSHSVEVLSHTPLFALVGKSKIKVERRSDCNFV